MIAGGASRSRSVANALALVASEVVVVHDAARPLARAEHFDGVVQRLIDNPEATAVIAATPLADTLKRAIGEPPTVEETVDRSDVWRVQTPQAFRTDALRAALAVPDDRLAAATDDATLVEARGGTVLVHPVDEPNPKVTTAADLRLAELLLGG